MEGNKKSFMEAAVKYLKLEVIPGMRIKFLCGQMAGKIAFL